MSEETTWEGWVPVIDGATPLAHVIEAAFDYRGDVTVVLHDGHQVTGYLYNRDADRPEPFVQMFDETGTVHTLAYRDILTIRFTGKDPAAGRSYEAWVRRKAERRPGGVGPEA